MKKHLFVALICLLGLSFASTAKPNVSKSPANSTKSVVDKAKETTLVNVETKKFFYECRAFSYQLACESSPTNFAICGNSLPEADGDVYFAMVESIIWTTEDIICPGYWNIEVPW
ncbi:MAG: hypothetical protein WAP48_09510 [Sediminibacterium sp.]